MQQVAKDCAASCEARLGAVGSRARVACGLPHPGRRLGRRARAHGRCACAHAPCTTLVLPCCAPRHQQSPGPSVPRVSMCLHVHAMCPKVKVSFVWSYTHHPALKNPDIKELRRQISARSVKEPPRVVGGGRADVRGPAAPCSRAAGATRARPPLPPPPLPPPSLLLAPTLLHNLWCLVSGVYANRAGGRTAA